MLLMDKLGRKALLLGSFIGMVIHLVMFSIEKDKLVGMICITEVMPHLAIVPGHGNVSSGCCSKCSCSWIRSIVFVCWRHALVSRKTQLITFLYCINKIFCASLHLV